MDQPIPERAIQALQLTQDEIDALDRTEHDTFAYNDAQVARAQVHKVLRLLTVEPTDFADYVIRTMPKGMEGFLREWGFDQYTAAMLSSGNMHTPEGVETDLSRRLDCIPPVTVMAWGLMRYAHAQAETDSDRYLRVLSQRGAKALGLPSDTPTRTPPAQGAIFEKLLKAATQWTEHQKTQAARTQEVQKMHDLASMQARTVADEISEFGNSVVPMHKTAGGVTTSFTYRRLVAMMIEMIWKGTYDEDKKHFPTKNDLCNYMLAEMFNIFQSQRIVFEDEGTMEHISAHLSACVRSKTTPHANLERRAIRKTRGRINEETDYIDNAIYKTLRDTTDWE